MRTLHADLATAQTATSATPYISITFSKGRGGATTYTYTTVDAANRIKAIRHSEEPYNTACVIVLDNHDRTLPDLFGYYCEISYGYVTSSGNKSSTAAPLWVKHQFHTSKMGSLDNVLYLEGVWNLLAEMSDIGSLLGATSPPYYEVDYTGQAYTIYDIVEQVLEAAGYGLHPLGGEDDSIIDTLQPDFVVNSVPFDNAASVIYRLLNMTKVFCRAEVNTDTYSGSTVATAGTVYYNHQRKVFYAAGRYWVFYHTGSYFYYKTSTDGDSWSEATTLRGGTYARELSIHFDGTYVHYAFAYAGGGQILYRRGTPETDGTITWSAAEQEAVANAGGTWHAPSHPTIAVDSNGYPFIFYRHNDGVATNWGKVVNSSDNDGTWTTDTTTSVGTNSANWCGVMLALTGGKMVVVYGAGSVSGSDEKVRARLWSGSSWGSEKKTTSNMRNLNNGFAAIAIGDTVHCVFNKKTDDDLIHCIFTTDWGSETTVQSVASITCPALSKDTQGRVYCFWYHTPVTDHIYYRVYDKGVWTGLVDFATDDLNPDIGYRMTAFYDLPNDDVFLVWERKVGEGSEQILFGSGGGPLAADFRIKYPSGYSSYDYTYVSDKPATTDHQFREFEWQDQPMIPTHVYVIANQSADGTWGSVITGEYQLAISTNNEYPDVVIYHVAATLTSQGDANNRAAAIALRMWMEEQLGRVVVPHNCGQELYDWIKIRDKRGAAAYTDYPPSRWGNEAVVGGLIHIYEPANGVYDLEITINGIVSSEPIDKTVVTEIPGEVEDTTQDILDTIVSVTGGIAPGQPFRPIYPRPTPSIAAAISPWNAMMNMLSGAASFRQDVMGQAVEYLQSLGYGQPPIGGGLRPGEQWVSPTMAQLWPEDPLGRAVSLTVREAAELRERAERLEEMRRPKPPPPPIGTPEFSRWLMLFGGF